MFDLFNHRFFFKIGAGTSNATLFSMLISYFVFIPLIILFLILAIGAFQRTTPHINVQEMDIIQRPSLTLDTQNYRLGFRFQTVDGEIMSVADLQNYFELSIKYTHKTSNQGKTQINQEEVYPFEPCLASEFADFQTFYDNNLQQALCVKNHSMLIEGYWDESRIGYASIQLKMCNSTKNSNCKSRDEIAQVFRGGYLYLHTETQNVNSLFYENPLKITMKTIQFFIDTKVRNEVSLYMQKMELRTFDGLIYNGDFNLQNYYKQTYYTSNSMSIADSEDLVWSCYILSSTKLLTVERYYTTLIEVAGIVGGVSKFLIIFGFIMTALYNERVLMCKLLNELYTFDLEKKKPPTRKSTNGEHEEMASPISRSPLPIKSDGVDEINYNGFLTTRNGGEKTTREYENNLITNRTEYVDPELGKPIDFQLRNDQVPAVKSNSQIDAAENVTPIEVKNFEDVILQKTVVNESPNIEIPAKMNGNGKKQIQNAIQMQEISFKESLKAESPKNLNSPNVQENGHSPPAQNHQQIFVYNDNVMSESQKNRPPLHFTPCEVLRSIFFPYLMSKDLRNRLELMREGEANLTKYIDILQMVKRFQELDDLKLIMLNQNQLALFNCISKPLITLKKQNDFLKMDSSFKITDMMKKYNSRNSKILHKEIVEKIKIKESKTEVDGRLLELVDEEVKEKIAQRIKVLGE